MRTAKARMKLELKGTSMPDGADHVFPSDISEITDDATVPRVEVPNYSSVTTNSWRAQAPLCTHN